MAGSAWSVAGSAWSVVGVGLERGRTLALMGSLMYFDAIPGMSEGKSVVPG